MRPAEKMAMPLDRAGEQPVRLEPVPVSDAIHVRVHDHEDGISSALAKDWIALADEASEPSSFAEHWFVAASLATLASGHEPRLIEVRRGGRLTGILPVAIERFYGRTTVRFVQNWCHHQMFLGTPLIRSGEEAAFWSAILDTLDAADWAPNFLHLRGLVENGPVHHALAEAAAARGRGCATVHREARALLAGGLDSRTYFERTVRAKKRKEIRRLQSRLAELGQVRVRRVESADALPAWCDAFLALEKASWKGRVGTALACAPETEAFFRAAVAGALAAGKLDFLRLDLDDRPVAMLVNFLGAPGAFSFKTCFDEEYSRFSPGVLIQLENLKILDRGDIVWMDSCAVPDHPMIDSLWSGRRDIVRVTVRLKGFRRSLVFAICRALEIGRGALRRVSARENP